jgi:hypothetical protein
MATVLGNCNIEEQRYVVRSRGKNESKKRIFIKKCFLFSGKCLSRRAGHNWVERTFRRCCPTCRSVEIRKEATVQRVDKLIRR